jgi:hypothetical protein
MGEERNRMVGSGLNGEEMGSGRFRVAGGCKQDNQDIHECE